MVIYAMIRMAIYAMIRMVIYYRRRKMLRLYGVGGIRIWWVFGMGRKCQNGMDMIGHDDMCV